MHKYIVIIFLTLFIIGCAAEEKISEPIIPGKNPEQIIEPEQPEISEENSIEKFEPRWQKRIDAALEKTDCPTIKKINYPEEYYQGPLIDTHLHIPAIPDGEEEPQETEGRFGGQKAILGWNVKISEIACSIKQEGTHDNFAFFPVYEDIPLPLLEIWKETMKQYPEQFTPFIMSSGNDGDPDGFPTVDAKTLQEMLEVHPDLFDGYGEIGLYERENNGAKALPPDSEMLQEIYPIIRKHKLIVYFHLGDGHKDNLERVLKQNPDINFVFHGDQLSPEEVSELIDKYPNLYYGVDAFWGKEMELFRKFVGTSKEDYLTSMDEEFNEVLAYEVRKWKKIIEKNPDQYLWGTDRGDAEWNYDIEVGQSMVKFARAFIGQLDPAAQEKIAYKNAEKLISST